MESSRDAQRRREARRRKAARRRHRAMLKSLCAVLFIILIVILVAAVILLMKGSEEPEGLNDPPATTAPPVADTTPPTADPVEITVYSTELPAPETLVTNVQDESKVTVTWELQPDLSVNGETAAKVLLTDEAGNTSVVEVAVIVDLDREPPVIEGAVDLEFYLGDPIAYKSNITVTDNVTEYPTLAVDNSQVDTSQLGTYPVTYTATDDAGNVTSVTVNLTLVEKPEGYVEPDVVYGLAQEILDEITTEEMTDMQVAFAIYRWVSTNIAYTGHSDKSSWTGGAYQAFMDRAGDCFNYYAAAKALYDVAGIANIDVVKVVTPETSQSSHYWSLINLGGGWYHVDCTPRSNPGKFFMNTDAELLAYSVENRNCHNFDLDAYPERATESVQDLVDYTEGTVSG